MRYRRLFQTSSGSMAHLALEMVGWVGAHKWFHLRWKTSESRRESPTGKQACTVMLQGEEVVVWGHLRRASYLNCSSSGGKRTVCRLLVDSNNVVAVTLVLLNLAACVHGLLQNIGIGILHPLVITNNASTSVPGLTNFVNRS